MNIFEIIKKHQSVSRFSDRALSSEKINKLLNAAMSSLNGNSKSSVKIIVITESAKKKEIREAAEKAEKAYCLGASQKDDAAANESWRMPYLEEAPCIFVVCGLAGQPYWAASTWLALGNLLLAADEEGLGARCCTPTMATYLQRILDIAPKYLPIAMIPVGYSADELFPTVEPEQRKALKNLFSGRYVWKKSNP